MYGNVQLTIQSWTLHQLFGADTGWLCPSCTRSLTWNRWVAREENLGGMAPCFLLSWERCEVWFRCWWCRWRWWWRLSPLQRALLTQGRAQRPDWGDQVEGRDENRVSTWCDGQGLNSYPEGQIDIRSTSYLPAIYIAHMVYSQIYLTAFWHHRTSKLQNVGAWPFTEDRHLEPGVGSQLHAHRNWGWSWWQQ